MQCSHSANETNVVTQLGRSQTVRGISLQSYEKYTPVLHSNRIRVLHVNTWFGRRPMKERCVRFQYFKNVPLTRTSEIK